MFTLFKIDEKYLPHKLFSYDRKKLFSSMRIDKSDIIFNEPMILIEYFGKSYNKNLKYHRPLYKFTYNPNLSQMGVYIDADFVWQSLVEFLSNKRSEKEISPEVSNENKILSKGFDLKTSFRLKLTISSTIRFTSGCSPINCLLGIVIVSPTFFRARAL